MGITNSKPENTPPPPQSQPLALTCEICIEPMNITDETSTSNKKFINGTLCSHSFCSDCIAKYITVKVTDDMVSDVPCPAPSCKLSLDPLTCRSLLPRDTFTKWSDNLCQKNILGLNHCYCPNRGCSAMVVNECGGRVRKAKCPDCKMFFCFKCGVKWHAGYKCKESREMRDQNDVAFGVLAETRNWMRCPRCNHCIELITGCRIVKCRCGTTFCYKCGKNLNKHFYCECKETCPPCCLRFCCLITSMLLAFFLACLGLFFYTKRH